MSLNPLQLLLSNTDPGAPLRSFDWDRYGVKSKYLVLFTGRTGSTLLTKIIQRAGVCGTPEEFFSDEYMRIALENVERRDMESYLHFLANTFSQNGYFGAEIDGLRFRWLQPIVNFENGVFDGQSTKYLWLTRQDIVSQGYSYAIAKQTGRWHQFNDAPAQQKSLLPEVADKDVWKEILMILQSEQYVESFLAQASLQPLRLNYEQLVTDRILTLGRILSFLGIPCEDYLDRLDTDAEPTRRLTYPDKAEFLLRFYDRYGDLLRDIEVNRANIDLISFRKRLTFSLEEIS